MRVLALEAYYGGSHRAFLDGWRSHSRHEFSVLSLPAHKWKWRMRHAAITFAHQLHQATSNGETWDVIWCSDMLNLAEFVGLAPTKLRDLPKVVYFHENQLTYPVQEEAERDLHFAFTNFITCQAADRIWFNSNYHQSDFLTALRTYLGRMPDYVPLESLESIEPKCEVQYPGIDSPLVRRTGRRRDQGLRICWNARWEHDKNPELFVAALQLLKKEGVGFRLVILGQTSGRQPDSLIAARDEFARETQHWGYVDSVEEYQKMLNTADVIVSTADHEFFGIGILEGIAAGLFPVVPNRLAYPEVMAQLATPSSIPSFYDGTAEGLASSLRHLESTIHSESKRAVVRALQRQTGAFTWSSRAAEMDDRLEHVLG